MNKRSVFNTHTKGLVDLLNYGFLLDAGCIMGKDGSLLVGYRYHGPDTANMTDAERNQHTQALQKALGVFDSNWITWHEALRIPAPAYSEKHHSHFPDAVSKGIDDRRREAYTSESPQFETVYSLYIQYVPPLLDESKANVWFVTGNHSSTPAESERIDHIQRFVDQRLQHFENRIGRFLQLRRMRTLSIPLPDGSTVFQDELLNGLHEYVTGRSHGLTLASNAMYLDGLIGGDDLWVGLNPKLGDDFLACISIDGFPGETYPQILEQLQQHPFPYRWSTRMIYLDQQHALSELKRYHRFWKQKVKGLWDQIFQQNGVIDNDALTMTHEVEAAMSEAQSEEVRFGFYTSTLVLRHTEEDELNARTQLLIKSIQRLGFNARVESINCIEAFLGSLPGHPRPNIRRPLIQTQHLSHLLPSSSQWSGSETCTSPLIGLDQPCLMHVSTYGNTPFRLNLHVKDVGHTLIFGPTGAGKSTLLGMIVAQFLRYKHAQVFAFEKGHSLWTLCHAVNGKHYDFDDPTALPGIWPLSDIDSTSGFVWASSWIEELVTLQQHAPPRADQKQAIYDALMLLKTSPYELRSLTEFGVLLQDRELRQLMLPYTTEGVYGHLFDNPRTLQKDAHLSVFELDALLDMNLAVALPILTYLFRQIETQLQGDPSLLVLDEAWILLGHPVFKEKIREWLKTLRKKNCAVVMATQSLSDASRSGILDVLIESCPTKIYLPNAEADSCGAEGHAGPRDFYATMGLNDPDIHTLKYAIPKQDYYYVSPEGKRLFQLNLDDYALQYVAAPKPSTPAPKPLKEASYV